VAVEAGYLPRNPCTVKGAGIERAAEMRHASIPQLHELADAVPARYRALILLAGYGGLRWAELVGLRRHLSTWPALGCRWWSRRPRSPARSS
jgi:integrase